MNGAFHLKVSSSARQFHKRHSCPTFTLGSQGELLQVAFNNQVDIYFIMVHVTMILLLVMIISLLTH